ncbi:MAG: hypothetical protein LUF29_00570 [Oscillospiraceae bacterium]|nr:hypothetical protein [Oscillospiraceae bacterium]
MKLLKRNKPAKRFLCLLLSIIMLATMVPVGVVAEDYSATYTFKNIVLSGYGHNGVVDSSTGAVTLTYSGQYQELQFTLPDGVDANSLTAISFDIESGTVADLDIKIIADGTTVQNTYGSATATLSSSTIETVSSASAVKIGVMYNGTGTDVEYVINSFTVTTSTEIVTYTETVVATQTSTGTLSILSGADFTDTELYLYVNYTLDDTSYSGWGAGALCDTSWHSAVSVTVNTTGVFAISLVDLAAAFSSYTYEDSGSGETVTVTDYDVSNGVILNLWGGYITFTSAQLVRISSSSATEYTITVDSCANGTVTADMDSATEGTTVTLTVTPDSGYELSTLTVTDGEGNEVTVADDYTFTMPASDVTVTATFVEEEADHCTDILLEEYIGYYNTATFNGDGTVTAGSTDWLNFALAGRKYTEGETVYIHISGTTTETSIRIYLSEGTSGRKTADYVIYADENGNFDTTVGMEVQVSDGSTYTGDYAVYVNIKSTDWATFDSLTLTHLGIVQYNVTVDDDITGGSVTTDKDRAGEGETVTLTVTPKALYELESLTVKDSSGTAVTVAEDYTFVMPASNVTVTATFTYTGTDDCGTVVETSEITLGGDAALTEGVYSTSSQYSGYIEIPVNSLSSGDIIKVHIVGTSYGGDMRIWLGTPNGNVAGECSSICYTSSYSSGDEIDLTITLTATADCSVVAIKGYNSGLNLSITHVGVTYYPSFYGRSLTMDGEIGVTYYFDMTGVTNPDEYVLETSLGDVTVSDETKTISGVTYYRYIVYVSPTDFDTTITATLTDGTTSVAVSDYSVYDYCATVLGTDDTSSELYAVKDLCEAVLNYGYYASEYYEELYGTTLDCDLQDDLASLISGWTDPVANWSDPTIDVSSSNNEITKYLALDSDGIYVIIKVDTGSTYTINGEELEVTSDGYIEYRVPAKEMADEFTIYKDGEVYDVYSVYSYVSNVINHETDSTYTEDVKNLCKAIYLYGEAAAKYTGWR